MLDFTVGAAGDNAERVPNGGLSSLRLEQSQCTPVGALSGAAGSVAKRWLARTPYPL